VDRLEGAGQWDYSAIGTVTNLASRLCDEAKGCQILISQQTMDGIEDLVETEAVAPLRLKGLSQPVPAFNVLGLRR